MNEKIKKIAAIVAAGVLVAGGFGWAGIAQTELNDVNTELEGFKETTEIYKENNIELKGINTELAATIDELKSQEPETVEVEVEKIVNVTNPNHEVLLEHLFNNDGEVGYLLDDLDDDELAEIDDRVLFINKIKDLSVDEVKAELFDELDGEEIVLLTNETYEFDDDDLEHLDVESDYDDISVLDVDFDDSDAEIEVFFDFEDDDDLEFEGSAVVEFDDGELDDIDEVSVVNVE